MVQIVNPVFRRNQNRLTLDEALKLAKGGEA
jgi:hypothetical protein